MAGSPPPQKTAYPGPSSGRVGQRSPGCRASPLPDFHPLPRVFPSLAPASPWFHMITPRHPAASPLPPIRITGVEVLAEDRKVYRLPFQSMPDAQYFLARSPEPIICLGMPRSPEAKLSRRPGSPRRAPRPPTAMLEDNSRILSCSIAAAIFGKNIAEPRYLSVVFGSANDSRLSLVARVADHNTNGSWRFIRCLCPIWGGANAQFIPEIASIEITPIRNFSFFSIV